MALYCGIDLHSNNHVVVVIDERDRRLLERRLPNNLAATLKTLEPYRDELRGVAVESTFNWYWLVDGLLSSLVCSSVPEIVMIGGTGMGGIYPS